MQTFRRTALLLGLMVVGGLTVTLRAMTGHGANMWEQSGEIHCLGSINYADSTRLVIIRIYDPNDQQIAFHSNGTNYQYSSALAYAAATATMSGTYRCNIVFEEEHRDLSFESDEWNLYHTR